MLKVLKALFSGAQPADSERVALATGFDPVAMHWFDGTRVPLPDWDAVAESERADWTREQRDDFYTAAAGRWLQAMAQTLGDGYRVHASDDFLLLSALEDRAAVVLLRFCQGVRSRIERNLGPISVPRADGKHVVIVFDTEDAYYDYIAHYYADGGEYAMSSGMFVHAGYGHFALFEGEMDHMQPTIAHELTHCMLAHLPIPAWLNEGMAVNTEHVLFPRLADPGRSLYSPNEIKAKHVAFWNAETIQEFWSGKSFLRTDDGNMLSYDLAKWITATAARDEASFFAFLFDADRKDAGLSAEGHLGYPLENLVQAVLGPGDWRPDPDRWHEGVERGQFRFASTR